MYVCECKREENDQEGAAKQRELKGAKGREKS